jgi:exopolysaccharide production protein ExoQ
MSPAIATVAYLLLIGGLFWLDQRQKVRTSWALWVPMVWFALAGSRSLAQWFDLGTPIESAEQVLEGSPADRLFYAFLLAIGLAVLLTRSARVGRILRANGPILFFFLYCLISLLWSDYPDVAFKRWIKAIGDLVMVMVVLSDREPLAAFKRLLARLGYFLIPLSILFIKYYPEIGRQYGIWEGETYYVGVTTNKNTLGAICLFLGLAALWQLLMAYGERKRRRWIQEMIAPAIILAMVLWLFAKINSMTSLSCFLIGGIVLCATSYRKVMRRPALAHVLIFSLVIVSASVLLLGASPAALKALGRNPTLTGRTEVWTMVLSLTTNPLLGTGFESFWLGPRLEAMWDRYWWHPAEAHNGYLEIYANLGWVGVVLLVVVLVTSYRAVFRAWRERVPVGSLCLAFFSATVIYNITEAAFFRMLHPVWMFFLLAVTSVSVIHPQKTRLLARNQRHRPGRLGPEPTTEPVGNQHADLEGIPL